MSRSRPPHPVSPSAASARRSGRSWRASSCASSSGPAGRECQTQARPVRPAARSVVARRREAHDDKVHGERDDGAHDRRGPVRQGERVAGAAPEQDAAEPAAEERAERADEEGSHPVVLPAGRQEALRDHPCKQTDGEEGEVAHACSWDSGEDSMGLRSR
ncbi:hypothetical protein ACFPRL_25975 [Pseudoclavibacter helvolus]